MVLEVCYVKDLTHFLRNVRGEYKLITAEHRKQKNGFNLWILQVFNPWFCHGVDMWWEANSLNPEVRCGNLKGGVRGQREILWEHKIRVCFTNNVSLGIRHSDCLEPVADFIFFLMKWKQSLSSCFELEWKTGESNTSQIGHRCTPFTLSCGWTTDQSENFGVKPAMRTALGMPSWLFLYCSVLGSLLGSRLLPSSSVAGSTGKGKGSKAEAQHHNPVSALIKCFLLTCTEMRLGEKSLDLGGIACWGLKGSRKALAGGVKAVPCSAGLHFVLCVMSALEHGLLHTGWGAQVMNTEGGEPRAPGHPCLAETVQQGLYSCSAELVLHLSSQEIFHGQQLWPVWFT